MQSFFRTSLWQSIKTSWMTILRTYWIPVLASVVTTAFGIIMTSDRGHSEDWIGHTFLTGILATILFGGVALLNQDRARTPLRTAGRYALGSIPLVYFVYVVYHTHFPNAESGITFALLIASSVFFLLCSAELRRESTSSTMWQFGLRSISMATMAAAVAVIGQIAASLAALSIEHLFQVHMPSEVYMDIAIIMFAFVAPILVIASASHVRATSRDPHAGFSPLLLRLVQIVFAPILTAYFLILYAYLLKIVFQWALPQESVVLPVLVYSIVGVCTYALVDPWRRAATHAIFKKLQLGILLSFLPLLVLYGTAIADRIRAYGMTEARYLCALFGVWLLALSIAFLRRRDLSLRVIPITLSALFLIAALPGVGAVASTVRSQQHQLVALLQQEQVLVDGKLVTNDTLSYEARTRINMIGYMLKDRKGLEDLAARVGLAADSDEDTVFNAVMQAVGSDTLYDPKHQSALFEYVPKEQALRVDGYDELYDVFSWPSPTFFKDTVIRFSGDGKTITVEHAGHSPLSLTLSDVPTAERPTYEAQHSTMRIRVIPTSAIGEKTKDGMVAAIRHLQVRVLVDYREQP